MSADANLIIIPEITFSVSKYFPIGKERGWCKIASSPFVYIIYNLLTASLPDVPDSMRGGRWKKP